MAKAMRVDIEQLDQRTDAIERSLEGVRMALDDLETEYEEIAARVR